MRRRVLITTPQRARVHRLLPVSLYKVSRYWYWPVTHLSARGLGDRGHMSATHFRMCRKEEADGGLAGGAQAGWAWTADPGVGDSGQAFQVCLMFERVFCPFRAAPAAYGGSQARGRIGAAAAGLRHSHSLARCELRVRPTPQRTATPDPSSRFLVGFASAAPRWELHG